MAVAASALGVVLVAVLASGIDGGPNDAGTTLAGGGGSAVVDAVVFALLTVGMALAIALVIIQFGDAGERVAPERTRQLLGAVLVVAVLSGLTAVLPTRDDDGEPEGRSEADDAPDIGLAESEPRPGSSSSSGALSGLAIGVVLVLVGSVWVWTRRRAAGRVESAIPVASVDDDRRLLHGLLDDALARLRSDPDPRRAVIRTWARLELALETAGLPRRPSEAPFDYLGRILESVDASGPAVGRLTETFERAMFSPHRIDRAAQLDAIDALVAVRDEVGVSPGEP